MLSIPRATLAAALAAALASLPVGDALAQAKKGAAIVCWKDKSGKVIGCGDRVPPEYQDAATKELDKRGITRGTTETAEERARAKALEEETAKKKEEEKRRQAELRRQDQALINTFSDPKEIDLKRDRELQVMDTQMSQLRVQHKAALDREKEVRGRIENTTKSGKPPTDNQKDDLARAEADRKKTEANIAAKEKEQADIRKRYADMKQRYIELRGGPTPAPAATAAAPGAPAAKK